MQFSMSVIQNIRCCMRLDEDENGLFSIKTTNLMKIPEIKDAAMVLNQFLNDGVISQWHHDFYKGKFKNEPASNIAYLIAKDTGFGGLSIVENDTIISVYVPLHKNYELRFV